MRVGRRSGGALAAGVAVLAALVPIGRWERSRHADSELAGMRRVAALVGPLDSASLNAYRVNVGLGMDCLLYRRGRNRFALELCFDKHGRLVEAIDRRAGGDPRVSSLREDPSASTIRYDRRLVDRLLARLRAPGYT
jgi:hypothetical protein